MKPKSINCLALFKHISIHGSPSLISCDHCLFLDIACVVMTDHPKCAVCTHCGCPCIGISLELLNHTHKKLESDLKAVIKECAEHSAAVVRLDAKLSRLLKQMKQNKTILTLKAHCVASELGDNNDETENEASPIVSKPNNALSPSFIDFLLSSPQNVEASSHSSWGFVWVPKLTLRYHILFTWQGSGLSH